LGILAEALHSGLDLAAAGVTLWAVHASSRPADREHAYGHGKIENLSALFETVLLLATCLWIIKEAVARLFFQTEVHVDANLWSFLVVVLSIVVDFSRSRALMHVARKYQSQALEADAMHFATDIWSSLVVLMGLVAVKAAHAFELPWLAKADAMAALGVAAVVVVVSVRLGKKSIADLLDTAPGQLPERIATLARVEGVRDVRQLRVRQSGPEVFIDLALVVDCGESLARGHDIACRAEAAIKHELPGSDIVVHIEPAEPEGEEDIVASARRIAIAHGAGAHNLLIHEEGGQATLELHLEVDANLPLADAHRHALAVDQELRRIHPELCRVMTHIEPAGRQPRLTTASPDEAGLVQAALLDLPELTERGIVPQAVEIRQFGSELSLAFRCLLPPGTSVQDAHDFSDRIERALRARFPSLGRVMVRTEPSG
jgi:cation diffusion facilitator family transporter